ncbi:MAG: permease [Chlamydiia bacterium]|nr:permease [Chlamydiia bacterium]
MNREPVALYIFRFITGLGLFAFMAMLYWSSLLIEADMKDLRTDLQTLHGEVEELQESNRLWQTEVLRALTEGTARMQALPSIPTEHAPAITNVQLTETAHPNLMQDDPFKSQVLTTLLPPSFRPWGVRKGASLGHPDNLHPFTSWSNVSSWVSLCTGSVAGLEFGKFETMAPDMAVRMERRKNDALGVDEFWVSLRDNLYWLPLRSEQFPDSVELAPHFKQKHKVTAHDFKFYLDVIQNPSVQEPGAVALRNYFGDIEEVRVIDDQTFVVRWKTVPFTQPDGTIERRMKYQAQSLTGGLQPLARWVYQYFPDGSKIVEDDHDPSTYRNNSVWAQNFDQHWARNIIVSCGPWEFEEMTDRKIVFKRNDDYYDPYAVLVKELEISFKETPDAVWQDFKADKLDTYVLQPDQLIDLRDFLASSDYLAQEKAGKGIKRLDYVSRAYTYLGWNQNTPYFKSKRVRQAMTMAIDRRRIIDQNLNGLGSELTGPFFPNSPSYDQSIQPWAYDPQQARQILEEEGWYDTDGSGTREKTVDGKSVPFRFGLTYYVKNPTAKALVDYVATALKEIGVECELRGVDIADLSSSFEEKSFDAILLGWALGTPPEQPRQLWHSSGAKEKGSSNAVGFADAEADALIDALEFEYDKDKRVELYHRFHHIIHEEQPYTFLYTPKTVFLYRDYVQNVFIPAERQDLVPGANVAEPDSSIFWLKKVQ